MTITLDGYVRVSRVGGREGEGFISPDVQERAIRDWAQRGGVEVVMQPHELNQSGGTMNRPIFNATMQRIREGRTGGIVVYKLDRFARTLLGAVNTLAEIGECGAVFASATEPELDYTTPPGRAFVQQMFVFAEFVRATSKEGWATAQRHAIERGVHISPARYFGYDKNDAARLVLNDDAPIVREVFERRAAGESWGSVADWLNEVAPKHTGMWTGQGVQRLCKKRVYVGEASRYVDQDVDGRGPIVNRSAHPAIVDEALWQAAQTDPARRTGGGHKDGQPFPLLSGLVRCAGCRFGMSIGTGPKGERMYRCRGRHTSGKCPQPASVIVGALHEYVQDLVLAEIEGTTRIVPDSAERDRAATALTQARADLDGFRQDREARRKLGAQWHEWLDDYIGAVRDAERQLAAIDAQVGAITEGLTRDHFLALPVDDRREVIGAFIDAIVVRRSKGRGRNADPMPVRTRVLWRGEAPDDMPRQRVRSEIVPFVFDEDIEAGVVAA